MIMDTQLVPTIRFEDADFPSNEWKSVTLKDIASFSKGKGLSKKDIVESGKTPCIRYAELYTVYSEVIEKTVSSTNVDPDKLELSQAGDVIIPASGEDPLEIASSSCVMSSGIGLSGDLNIIRHKENGVFLAYYLNSAAKRSIARVAQGTSVTHLYKSQLQGIKINLPTLPEQQKIATFLTLVDRRLVAARRRVALLRAYKRGVMQEIFNSLNDYEEVKLGELTKKVGKRNKEAKDLPVYSINNHTGFLPQSDQFEGVDSNERGYDTTAYKIVRRNTFAYNPARINVGSIGFSGEIDNVLVSSLYVCFQTTGDLLDNYLGHYLDTYQFNKAVLRNSEGGVRSYLFYENFSRIRILLPPLSEQTRIASILTTLDARLSVAEREVAGWEVWKRGLLGGMLV